MNSKEYALIVAGGRGTRIKSDRPKQFLLMDGLPVLMHTILAFYKYSQQITVVLVLPETEVETWHALCAEHDFTVPLIIQVGGETRFQSVKRGLEKIDEGLVAIHDGVRPLVNQEIIAASFRMAAERDAAVAAVPLKESIRILEDESTRAMDRSRLKLIQTPQTFRVSLIKSAYEIKEDPAMTDDASVAEKAGCVISLFDGSYDNIKITTAEDLIVAEALFIRRRDSKKKKAGTNAGFE
jgi:2-C-methyl-D-erythritol 4-phosphate cytidylyltransferase